MSFGADPGWLNNEWRDGVFMVTDYDRGVDPSLLVLVRQGMLVLVLIFAIIVVCICRHVASVHLWLEGAWWFCGTSLAIFLVVIGIVELIADRDAAGFTVGLHVIEQIELAVYLTLSFLAAMSRTKYARKLSCARTCFWMSTIIMSIMWTISAVIEFMMSNLIVFSAVITMSGTTITALFMLADIAVLGWHKTDPNVTEEQAKLAASRPFWERFSRKKAVQERMHSHQDDDYAAIVSGAPQPYAAVDGCEPAPPNGMGSSPIHNVALDNVTGASSIHEVHPSGSQHEIQPSGIPSIPSNSFLPPSVSYQNARSVSTSQHDMRSSSIPLDWDSTANGSSNRPFHPDDAMSAQPVHEEGTVFAIPVHDTKKK
eukprot:TRINITY_DN246_c0_g1_i1.p1 TRINITY_DN246_c0_g1~~TRINITY_DN246_c0_g1_i1.p1  ORF type:complete len:370 (+),score=34.41 TRINITY_DN246_c0_g1_i1:258-1367(+)